MIKTVYFALTKGLSFKNFSFKYEINNGNFYPVEPSGMKVIYNEDIFKGENIATKFLSLNPENEKEILAFFNMYGPLGVTFTHSMQHMKNPSLIKSKSALLGYRLANLPIEHINLVAREIRVFKSVNNIIRILVGVLSEREKAKQLLSVLTDLYFIEEKEKYDYEKASAWIDPSCFEDVEEKSEDDCFEFKLMNFVEISLDFTTFEEKFLDKLFQKKKGSPKSTYETLLPLIFDEIRSEIFKDDYIETCIEVNKEFLDVPRVEEPEVTLKEIYSNKPNTGKRILKKDTSAILDELIEESRKGDRNALFREHDNSKFREFKKSITGKKKYIISFAQMFVENAINYYLQRIVPKIKIDENAECVPSWESPTLLAAIYYEYFLNVTKKYQYLNCSTPNCHGFCKVSNTRGNQKYCTPQCGANHRSAICKAKARKMERTEKNK